MKAYEAEYDAFHEKLGDDIFAAPTAEEVHALLRARRFVILQGPPVFVEHAPGEALHLMPGHACFLVKDALGARRARARPTRRAALGGRDAVARLLLAVADDLLFRVRDVLPLAPRRGDLDRLVAGDRLLGVTLRRGLEVVVSSANAVHVIDAKYNAHLAERGEHGWQRFTEDSREAHRADIHQVLAYAALYSADEVSASLVYPLRRATFDALARRGRDRSVAHLLHGARRARVTGDRRLLHAPLHGRH